MKSFIVKLFIVVVLYIGLGCGKNHTEPNAVKTDTVKSTKVLPCGCDSPVIKKYTNEQASLGCFLNDSGYRQYMILIDAGPNGTRTVYICDTTFPPVTAIVNNQLNKTIPVIFSGELKNRCKVEYTIWEKLYNITLTGLAKR